LLKAADEGLFLAKRSGRNCVATTNAKGRAPQSAPSAEDIAGIRGTAVDATR
jgi:hypothetical protein